MIVALAIFAGATPALACDRPITQLDMNLCSQRDYEAADRELNAAWPKAVALMSARDRSAGKPTDGRPTYSAALLTAQRAWLAYRDAQCRVEGFSMRGGSAEPLAINGCLTQLTKTRIQQLKDLEQGY